MVAGGRSFYCYGWTGAVVAKLEANQAQVLEPISVQTELPISITLMVIAERKWI